MILPKKKSKNTNNVSIEENNDKKSMPSILSVAAQYPEHKRTVNEALLPKEEEPSVKKTRIQEQEADAESSVVGKKNDIASIGRFNAMSRWLMVALVPVAAAVTIMGFRMIRKK